MKTWVNGIEVLESEMKDKHIYDMDLIFERVASGEYINKWDGNKYEYHFTTNNHNTVPPYELIQWYCNS